MKSRFMKLFIVLFTVLIVIQSAYASRSWYYLLTEARDINTDDYIDPAHIHIWSTESSYDEEHDTTDHPVGDPRVYFYDVPSDELLNAEYSAVGYKTDIDDYFFDSELDSCVGAIGSECTLNTLGFITDCSNYETDSIHMLYCSVYNNDQSFAFIYRPDWYTVAVGDLMYPVECMSDSDCDHLDDTYCSGDMVLQDNGRCISNECTVQTLPMTDCNTLDGNYCSGDSVIYNDYTCNSAICVIDDSTLVKDCNDDDNDYCSGTEVLRDDYTCLMAQCALDDTITVKDCDDGLYCNGQESCVVDDCVQGTAVDCSGNNLPEIDTCYNNPDNNPRTLDYAAAFTSVCNEITDSCTQGSQSLSHTCSVSSCAAECDATHSCAKTECDNLDGCVGDDYYDYADVSNTCLGDCTCTDNQCGSAVISYNDPRCTECQNDNDCNYLDHDYCGGNFIRHDEGRCINYDCTVQTTTTANCDNLDNDYCSGTEIFHEDYVCMSATCVLNQAYPVKDCNDGLYCNGAETCQNANCVFGTQVDCSGNDLPTIATCYNNPDNNPRTWDYAAGFTSECNEVTDSCTQGSYSFSHTCTVLSCGAECDATHGCADTECDNLDGCVGDDYYDYHDRSNSCLGDCTCTDNQCTAPTIYQNDARCTQCQTDNDCNYLDMDYCDGTEIKHREGRCISFQCTGQVSTVMDCNDGLYCNGQESCQNANCVSGQQVDCSGNNLPTIATCYNNPDNNPMTWDYATGFTSVCNEVTDSCTQGSYSFSHTCSVSSCGAECDAQYACPKTECDNLDGCLGPDYYDYHDVSNSCLSNCLCQDNQCSDVQIYVNDPRCGECQHDSDCNQLDRDYCDGTQVRHDEGRCLNYECVAQTTLVQECDNGLYCDGQEFCSNANCYSSSPVDCSQNDLAEIATCYNNPDNNPLTWDFAPGFISECDEDNDMCTECIRSITHVCSVLECDAECDATHGCAKTECDNLDGCVGKDYYNYADRSNSCLGDCTCTDNQCSNPSISYNDPRCVECDDDDDCNHLDSDYCDGTLLKHREGKCINYECTSEVSTVQDCNDGLYCNGAESCQDAQCVAGNAIDCSGNNLPTIAACNNNPDSNPRTWDFAPGFTSICNEATDSCMQGSYSFTHTCSVSSCGAECDAQHPCVPTECDNLDGCVGDNYYDYNDKANSCLSNCLCQHNQCTNPTVYYNDDRCTECQTDDDCNYLDHDYCQGSLIKHVEGRCIDYQCVSQTSTTQDCNDGLYCNGQETCQNVQCMPGTPVDCSANDVTEISTCYNNPDNNPYTYDFRCGFNSVCNEATDSCTTGCLDISHTCDAILCNAECDATHSCPKTDCDYLDGCQGVDYYDYDDRSNTCLGDCTCTHYSCSSPKIYYQDVRCSECQTDDDCNYLDEDFCDGDIVKHREGRCHNWECIGLVTNIEFCNGQDELYCSGTQLIHVESGCVDAQCVENTHITECDDGLYCNGQESCSNAQCRSGQDVDCSANDLAEIATCYNNPDNNPMTWDFAPGFTSVCDEDSDTCTTCERTLTHSCSVLECNAECDSYNGCADTDCDHLDSCVGRDYYDYDDVANGCLGDCTCEDNQCGAPTIHANDPRCGECSIDDDCNNLDADYCTDDLVMHDEGRCVNNECVAETTTVQDCSMLDNDYCSGTEILADFYTCHDAECVLYFSYMMEDCDDGLYCNGQESCSNAECVAGNPIDCSANDVTEISTCYNNPDNNPFTFDFRCGFNSVCNEAIDSCTTGCLDISHTCDVIVCNAECDDTHGCDDTDCDFKDGCMGNDYYDYDDVANNCQTDCSCEENSCGAPNIIYNDPRCVECQYDSDCNHLDRDYCEGTMLIHAEGKCIDYQCISDDILYQDCDDGVYCNGQESCVDAECIQGQNIDCSQYDLPTVAECNANPDNNPRTWDLAPGFTSYCNEATDSCTQGSYSFMHMCSISGCGAECEDNNDCAYTECDHLDGCVGEDYYDYYDVSNDCLDSCQCEDNQCDSVIIIPEDIRCIQTCLGEYADCLGSGEISGSRCYYGPQENLCLNPPQWECNDGAYVDCDDYDDFDLSDDYVADADPSECSSECSGIDCCHINDFECNYDNLCDSGIVDNDEYFCFNDGEYYLYMSDEPPSEICGDGLDNDCDGFIDEGCNGGITVDLTPDKPWDESDIYCNAEISNDEFTYVNYVISGDYSASGSLPCDNDCSLSVLIPNAATTPGDHYVCTMSFNNHSGTDDVYVYNMHFEKNEEEDNNPDIKMSIIGDDFVKPGDFVEFSLELDNDGPVDLENVEVKVTLSDSEGIFDVMSYGPMDIDTSDESSILVVFQIPMDAEPGMYTARFVITEGDLRRVKHRTFIVI